MYRVDSHKSEIINKIVSAKIKENTMLYVLLVLIILIGINSLVSTVLWINKCRIQLTPLPSLAYNKQLNESKMSLNQSA